MPPRRHSIRRVLLVATLVLLALLLLELGRLLPGSWPGGGGGSGSRTFPTGFKVDPTHLVPTTTPAPVVPRPAEPGTLHVVVRRADGTPVEGGSVVVAAGRGRGASVDLIEGEAVLALAATVPDDWSITLAGGVRVEHGRAPERGDGRFVVTLPRRLETAAPSATALDENARPGVRVEDQDGHPVAGAAVAANGAQGELEVETGADGAASVPAVSGVQRLCVTAAGFGETCVYARLVAGRPLHVRLWPTRMRRTTFVDAVTGEPLRARSVTLIDRRGATKRLERDSGTFDQFTESMPDDLAAESTLEIDVEGRPPVRVPISSMGATTTIPTGAPRTIRVLAEMDRPVEGALVTARFASHPSSDRASESNSEGPLEMKSRTDANGGAVFSLPLDRDTDLEVDAPGFAASGLRVPAGTPVGATSFDVRVSRGVDCEVSVTDPHGAAIANAEVIMLFAAGRSTARRRATTDVNGLATLPAIPRGRVEVLAHRAGHAWASQTGKVAEGADRFAIVLHPGRRLTLVVEDASGVPLPRVAIRSVARSTAGSTQGEGTNDAANPDEPLPWETTGNGVLVVDDLPDFEVDLYLSKSGFDDEIIARVRPGPSTWFATMVETTVQTTVRSPTAAPK